MTFTRTVILGSGEQGVKVVAGDHVAHLMSQEGYFWPFVWASEKSWSLSVTTQKE
jgi:hypothetical protein